MFNFKKLTEKDLERVFNWRQKPFVTKYQFTDIQKDYQKHLDWFARVSKDPNFKYWVIHLNERPIGLFNLSNFDVVNSRTNAGYYIGEEDCLHLGGIVPPYLYNYVFQKLKMNKIYGEVVEGNSIIKIHLLHGYRQVGTYQQHITKNKEFFNVHAVELMAQDWLKLRRYSSYTCPFED
ncbi:MAG: UDP-4-amino-4,6-dideoxy-N-acetyl-beta-L-altrosamine N-acetyltransferase [Bacteriovoracaceae bacterium]